MISVVVPAYNAEGTLPACLVALRGQALTRSSTVGEGASDEACEVVVVDDGSTDATSDVARRWGARVVQQPHRGPAAARNAGTHAALGELVLFTDADCEPAPDWVAAMARPFADPRVAGCKGVYRTRQQGRVARWVQAEYEDRYRSLACAKRLDFVDTYSAGYRRVVLRDEGGFDESFPVPSVEDVDLSFRLAETGYRLVFVPDAVVYHRHPDSVWGYALRKFRYGRWRVRIYSRYPGKLRGDSHTPEVLRWQLALAGLASLAAIVALVMRVVHSGPWWVWMVPVVPVAAFFGTTVPHAVRAARCDPAMAPVAPAMLAVRALALGTGLALGLAQYLLGRIGAAIWSWARAEPTA